MAASLKSGKIVIERNGQYVSMAAPDLMNMEISAKEKKDKNELSIELSWRKEPFVPDIAPLTITSEEPPEPEEEMKKEEIPAAKEAPQKTDTGDKATPDTSKSPLDAAKTATKTPPKNK